MVRHAVRPCHPRIPEEKWAGRPRRLTRAPSQYRIRPAHRIRQQECHPAPLSDHSRPVSRCHPASRVVRLQAPLSLRVSALQSVRSPVRQVLMESEPRPVEC